MNSQYTNIDNSTKEEHLSADSRAYNKIRRKSKTGIKNKGSQANKLNVSFTTTSKWLRQYGKMVNLNVISWKILKHKLFKNNEFPKLCMNHEMKRSLWAPENVCSPWRTRCFTALLRKRWPKLNILWLLKQRCSWYITLRRLITSNKSEW